MEPISLSKYEKFRSEYYGGPMRISLRLGQAFMNRFARSEANPRLFYMTDNTQAERIIMEDYVDLNLEDEQDDA